MTKNTQRKIRHKRIRKKLSGTSEKPRLVVYRSLTNIYCQIIDDAKGVTIESASTMSIKKKMPGVEKAKELGKTIAASATKKGIKTVVFDRNGYKYHGKIKEVADAARENGLQF